MSNLGPAVFLIAFALLFCAYARALRRVGFRWRRRRPPVPSYDFRPGKYRTLNFGTQIGLWSASYPFGSLKMDESWARLRCLPFTVWIERAETVEVERLRILGRRAVMFRSRDGRYDNLVVFGHGSAQLLGAFGWPTGE